MSQINSLRELVEQRKREAEFLDEIASNWERLEKWEEFTRAHPDILPRTVTLYGGGATVAQPSYVPDFTESDEATINEAEAEALAEIAELERENARLRAGGKPDKRRLRGDRTVGHLRAAIEALSRLAGPDHRPVPQLDLERDPQLRLIGKIAFSRVLSKLVSSHFAVRDDQRRLVMTPEAIARAKYYEELPRHRTSVSKDFINHKANQQVPSPVEEQPAETDIFADIKIDRGIPLPTREEYQPEPTPVPLKPSPITEESVLGLLPATFKELKSIYVDGGFDTDTLLPAIQNLRGTKRVYQDESGMLHASNVTLSSYANRKVRV